MLRKYLFCFLISMVPMLELRGAIPAAVAMRLDYFTALPICVVGNMLPVPFIYLFARRILFWGRERKYIGKYFARFIERGERTCQKLVQKTGQGGLFLALLLFVGIPVPGTGAWTGTLAASFLDMGLKNTTLSVSLGVILAGLIMGVASTGVFSVIGL